MTREEIANVWPRVGHAALREEIGERERIARVWAQLAVVWGRRTDDVDFLIVGDAARAHELRVFSRGEMRRRLVELEAKARAAADHHRSFIDAGRCVFGDDSDVVLSRPAPARPCIACGIGEAHQGRHGGRPSRFCEACLGRLSRRQRETIAAAYKNSGNTG